MYNATWQDGKINKNEVAKLAEDGLDVFKDLPELIKKPFSEVDPSYYMYFKYAGLTVQKPQADGNFMMRIKIPGGIATTKMARYLSSLAKEYGKGVIDITTRQSVQYHWIPFAKLPAIFAAINAHGMTTAGAEGDITRNVIDNPLAGIDPLELFDTRATVQRVHKRFQDNTDYSNLPRKMKISISSNVNNAANAEINDLAFVPATKRLNNRKILGFNVKIGGGLGMKPYLALPMNIFVTRSEVADVSEAVVALYRDHGYRRSRTKARLKFLIEDWGVEKFEAALREKIPNLKTAGKDETLGWTNGTILGIHEQKQSGLYYVGVNVPAGRLYDQDFDEFIRIADEFGNGEIRFDHSQNLIIPNIPQEQLAALKAEPIFEKYPYGDNTLQSLGMACTGSQYCNLAHTRSKEILNDLLPKLDQKFHFEKPVRIVVTGCGNGCAHRAIADLGVEGVAARDKDKNPIEAFKLSVGGSLLNGGHFNETLKGIVPLERLEIVTNAFLSYYKEEQQNETFYDFYQRVGGASFQALLNEVNQ
jgi:ferredoxin-nitrite reductase